MKIAISFEQTDPEGKQRRAAYEAEIKDGVSMEQIEAHLTGVLRAMDEQIDSVAEEEEE